MEELNFKRLSFLLLVSLGTVCSANRLRLNDNVVNQGSSDPVGSVSALSINGGSASGSIGAVAINGDSGSGSGSGFGYGSGSGGGGGGGSLGYGTWGGLPGLVNIIPGFSISSTGFGNIFGNNNGGPGGQMSEPIGFTGSVNVFAGSGNRPSTGSDPVGTRTQGNGAGSIPSSRIDNGGSGPNPGINAGSGNKPSTGSDPSGTRAQGNGVGNIPSSRIDNGRGSGGSSSNPVSIDGTGPNADAVGGSSPNSDGGFGGSGPNRGFIGPTPGGTGGYAIPGWSWSAGQALYCTPVSCLNGRCGGVGSYFAFNSLPQIFGGISNEPTNRGASNGNDSSSSAVLGSEGDDSELRDHDQQKTVAAMAPESD
ncbi:glycine-rich cell wall structural protein-like [Carica papaya]|uniref:glycine-rich cell wall structural protein-like n=1 Tax=Carica papaya TaxID=3649 RepID=UPI000B8C7A2A|nr:glycine-rich cell wall structural protein-like [Carica papaya]